MLSLGHGAYRVSDCSKLGGCLVLSYTPYLSCDDLNYTTVVRLFINLRGVYFPVPPLPLPPEGGAGFENFQNNEIFSNFTL